MDPNLFHLDWERVSEVLATIVVLSFLVERALAPLFESRFFLSRFEPADQPARSVKEPTAFVLALVICVIWKFDAVSVTVLSDRTNLIGELVTAGVIAGGSKASVKLFRDVMGFRSTAVAERDAERKVRLQATLARAHRSASQEPHAPLAAGSSAPDAAAPSPAPVLAKQGDA